MGNICWKNCAEIKNCVATTGTVITKNNQTIKKNVEIKIGKTKTYENHGTNNAAVDPEKTMKI